jgi:dihydroorotate dehydrogenase
LEKVLEVTEAQQLAGIIACNTSTKMREEVFPEHKVGGLSGRPLLPRTKEIVGFLRQRDDKIPIIASGGINRADDARELIDHYGANLVQTLTGLVFHGPALVRAINEMKLSR